jgi:glutamate 5-kinase
MVMVKSGNNMKKKLILKIGTSTLTANTDKISRAKIRDVARQIVILKKKYDIVLVSSGAIATARQFIDIDGSRKYVDSKQAMAAIGQPKLMRIYDEVFSEFGLNIAQCLMTYRDFEDAKAKANTKNTINKLLKYDYIPIINENDTLAIEEIVLGDNDKLSALVACILNADLLVLASNIDGLYDKNPHLFKDAKLIKEVKNLRQASKFVHDRKTKLGVGGMASKIKAAQICRRNGIEIWITNGGKKNFLIDSLAGKIPFTKFKC